MKRAAMFGAVLLLSALAGSGAVLAQTGGAGAKDPVVATVNGDEIVGSDVRLFYESLPAQYRRIPMQSLYPQLVERLIDQKLVAAAARKEGLAERPAIKRRLALAVEGMLHQIYIEDRIKAQVTKERLREAYQKRIATEPKREEVRARHILLKTRDDAMAVIAELKAGADFAELARKKSTGPSASNGGDLGFFAREQMVKAFSDAAFALKAGETTSEPVKTQFGWHVIKVEERRVAASRSFEEMTDELRQSLTEKVYDDTVAGLRAKAKVTVTGGGIKRVP